jgi:hypothetical protein
MKLKLTALLALTVAGASAQTAVSLRNFFGPTEGYPIVDNTGAVIDASELSFEAGTISDAGALSALTAAQDAEAIALFTPATSAGGGAGIANFAGLFNGSTPADDGNGLDGQDLFIMVSRTVGGSVTDVMIFDAGTFPTQSAGNAATGLEVRDASDVVFGGFVSPVSDDSALPGPLQGNYTTGLSFSGDVIPEPSTSLLAALAGLGLVARRRR